MDKSGMKLVLNQGDENDNNGGWPDGSVWHQNYIS